MRLNRMMYLGGLGALAISVAAIAQQPPMQVPLPLPPAQDIPYRGTLTLAVDARDVARRIIRVREEVPTAGGEELVLLYPMWMPGNHAPRGVIQNLAGLRFTANGRPVEWRRDPVNVAAFRISVPENVRSIVAEFEYLAPLTREQGRIILTSDFLNLPWNAVLLYPAGHYARQIGVRPSLMLPDGWTWSSALSGRKQNRTIGFERVTLETLVDSPLYGARHMRRFPLDIRGKVHLNVSAETPEALAATDAQIKVHIALIGQADKLFGTRPFEQYDFLLALSDRLPAGGTEHQRSSENRSDPGYFTQWDKLPWTRTLLPHEYVHAWNGKFRRPELTFTADYNTPTRNELLWVYEGLTNYYGWVLTARSGLVSQELARSMLADTAARYTNLPGRRWRSLTDATNSTIMSNGNPLPWPDYQRSGRDYYDEGTLLWLEVDTIIRERSAERRSLDDLMRNFFAGPDGDRMISTYDRDDLIAALQAVQPYPWREFFVEKIDKPSASPLTTLDRTGHRLTFTSAPSEYFRLLDAKGKETDLTHSFGLTVADDGEIQAVAWDSPAFDAQLAAGMRIVAVDDIAYTGSALRDAVTKASRERRAVSLLVRDGTRIFPTKIDYRDGPRYPALERVSQTVDRLGAILAPR